MSIHDCIGNKIGMTGSTRCFCLVRVSGFTDKIDMSQFFRFSFIIAAMTSAAGKCMSVIQFDLVAPNATAASSGVIIIVIAAGRLQQEQQQGGKEKDRKWVQVPDGKSHNGNVE